MTQPTPSPPQRPALTAGRFVSAACSAVICLALATLPPQIQHPPRTGQNGASILPQAFAKANLLDKSQADQPTTTAPINHSPTLAALDHGRMAMAWYAGSREGAKDVNLLYATWGSQGWSQPKQIMSVAQVQTATQRYTKKLGNPLLLRDPQGRVHLIFVTVSLGGWGGARLNHAYSDDEGNTWSEPRLLVASPFLNVSTLVRSKAWVRQDGNLVVPAYFELTSKYPLLLTLSRDGRLLDRQRFGGVDNLLQPSVVVFNQNHLQSWFRRAAEEPRRVFVSQSNDGGLNWSQAQAIALPNGDSSVSALAFDAQKAWLLANPLETKREVLSAFLLQTNQQVEQSVVLEQQQGVEFSYPSLEVASDGKVHLVYTAQNRKELRHKIWPTLP